jgi:hypothetical protein
MAIKIVAGIACILALLAVVIATRPSEFHVERSIVINAPPAAAFTQVNDFHRWAAWSPFEKLDPDMKRTFDGPTSGVGAGYGWSGNGKAGEGRMTIVESLAASKIGIRLAFTKPMQATNKATFTFTPTDAGTKVTWAMDGKNNFAAKAFHMVMDMDKLVGGEFEHGLGTLKTIAERTTVPQPSAASL